MLKFSAMGTASGGDDSPAATNSTASSTAGAASPPSTKSAIGKPGPKCTVASGSPYAAYAGVLCGAADRHPSRLSYLLALVAFSLLASLLH